MGSGFLDKLAEKLYKQYGDDISSLVVIFPSRRARLFFSDAISHLSDKPLWQPVYLSLDEVMESIAGITSTDRVRLMVELYKAYSRYHEEAFDTFYFWGEMLLGDFDSIDKYRIDARMLFTNLADLRRLDDLSYLTDEQRKIIARFWNTFDRGGELSEEKRKFLSIWDTLWDIYRDFKEALSAQEMAYPGMVYRQAADKVKAGTASAQGLSALVGNKEGCAPRIVIAGFNALSECEKVVFDFLSVNADTLFFWDYDSYYLGDQEQEAGLFMRRNVRNFPEKVPLGDSRDHFAGEKMVKVISAPSDSMQAKYVAEYVAQMSSGLPEGCGRETAIVLTDESLLVPVLHSIPPAQAQDINITMGYPLRLTLAYSFVERLIELQSRARESGGKFKFYHSDVTGLLSHPYLSAGAGETGQTILENVLKRQLIYVASEYAGSASEAAAEVFTAAGEQWQSFSAYLLRVMAKVVQQAATGEDDKDRYRQTVEFFNVIADNIRKLANSLEGCGVDMSRKVFSTLLRKVLQNTSVPYEGEPLQGIQVMGILETRNLDFKNVLLLSANDDNFPGNRAVSSSFIPNSLRLGYGLPTPLHHEGVYAYYFYRLLQRAENIHIVYNSQSDEKSSGEQSRYIYQLEYESPHHVERAGIGLNVNVSGSKEIRVHKTGTVVEKLKRFTKEIDPVRLSPTALFNYITCPLKFYFKSVARLRPDDEVNEEVDAPMFGNILHKAMERLYGPLKGIENPTQELKAILSGDRIQQAVDYAIASEFFKSDKLPENDMSGNLVLIREIVSRYISGCIVPYDIRNGKFTVMDVEKEVSLPFTFEKTGSDDLCITPLASAFATVRFGGIADRVDTLAPGMIRVVDYKTGAERLDFKGMDALFSQDPGEHNPAVFQTLLYSMMLRKITGADVMPALYYVRTLNKPDYSPLVKDKQSGREMLSYSAYAGEFETKLAQLLAEIFDTATPFTQCESSKNCTYCDFNLICRR